MDRLKAFFLTSLKQLVTKANIPSKTCFFQIMSNCCCFFSCTVCSKITVEVYIFIVVASILKIKFRCLNALQNTFNNSTYENSVTEGVQGIKKIHDFWNLDGPTVFWHHLQNLCHMIKFGTFECIFFNILEAICDKSEYP